MPVLDFIAIGSTTRKPWGREQQSKTDECFQTKPGGQLKVVIITLMMNNTVILTTVMMVAFSIVSYIIQECQHHFCHVHAYGIPSTYPWGLSDDCPVSCPLNCFAASSCSCKRELHVHKNHGLAGQQFG